MERQGNVISDEEGTKKPKKNKLLCNALVRAAGRGDAKRVRELLQSEGVDSSYALERDFYGRERTSLRLACENGHAEVARVLLEHGGAAKQQLALALYDAAWKGHADVLKVLLEKGVDPRLRDNLALRWAAEQGHCEAVEILLSDPRVDPADQDNDAVSWAAEHGHGKIVELLLADHRVVGTRAIPKACSRVLHVLLEDERCGINVNRALFEQHHRREVLRFDALVAERTARICAVSWAMQEIGDGWGDLREPLEERMQRQPVDWGKK